MTNKIKSILQFHLKWMEIKKEKINMEMDFMFLNKIIFCLLRRNLFLQEFSLLIMRTKHVIN